MPPMYITSLVGVGKILGRTLLGVVLALFLVIPASAQEKPLTVDVLVYLLTEGVSSQRLARLVIERGVNFEVTPSIRQQLEAAGANVDAMNSIERAAMAVTRRRLEARTP